jgi:hypothetical protein
MDFSSRVAFPWLYKVVLFSILKTVVFLRTAEGGHPRRR